MTLTIIKKLSLNKLAKLKANEANKGFTLVESLVAIALLVTVIGGTLTVSARSLILANEAHNKIIAFYLSQEPIEMIRQIRDSNRLSGSAWLSGLGDCDGADCYVDAVNATITACGGPCPAIRRITLGADTGYGYGGGVATDFVRTTRITEIVAGEEAEIAVTVDWSGRFNPKQFVLRERMFNW